MKPKKQKKMKPKKQTEAIVVASPVAPQAPAPVEVMVRRHQLNQAEITLLKNTVARGVSDDEFAMFLWVAKKHKLDPMTRQLHAVKRYMQKHHQDDKGIWVGGDVMTIQIGIDGYRTLAARNHKDFGGVDEPEFEFGKLGDKIPTRALVRVWKKGFEHPSIGVAYWDEYAPSNLDEAKCFMWKKMPKHMLAKCAEALALRRAYPDLSDIYTDEEMEQHQQDFTPEGRQIVLEGGLAPSGLPVTYEAQLSGAAAKQQEVLDAHLEDFKKKEAEQLKALEKPKEEPMRGPNGTIELHWMGDKDLAYLGGDGLGKLLDTIKKDCLITWMPTSKRNVITIDSIPKLKEICAKTNYRCVEVQDEPNKFPASSAVTPTNEARKPAAVQERETVLAPQQPAPAAGTIREVKVIQKDASGLVERISVNWGGIVYTVFDKKLFEFLRLGVGKEAELIPSANKRSVVGIKRIAQRTFTDGYLPDIQMDEERSKTIANLFQ